MFFSLKNKTSILLLLILLVAVFFRFYNLSSVPPSPSLDETSIGYNAYSILHTGADEYSYKFPLLLRAYDDWRPAFYVYLVIPFIQLFGLSALAVRLPSVILSVISVYLTYILVLELLKNQKGSLHPKQFIALLAAFFLAISPWHIYISRLGHEANLGLFCLITALLGFLKFINTGKKMPLFLSALFFSLSLYAYQSQKVVVPFLLLGILFIFFKKIGQGFRTIVLAALFFIVFSIPIVVVSLSPDGLIRFKGTTAFSANNPIYREHTTRVMEAKNSGNLINQVIYNRRFSSVEIFLSNYLSHFNPVWLFTNSGNESHKVPNIGLLYIWELPLILLGFFQLFILKIDRNKKLFFLLWLLSSPLPAALTTEAPHAMRSYTFLPSWQILSALGFYLLYQVKGNDFYRSVIVGSLIGAVLISIGYMFINYFHTFPKEQSASFQYAFSEAIPYILKNEKSYDTIIFSNKDNLYQSYMFFLFYSKYNPYRYQQEGGTKSGGFAKFHKIGKFHFRPIEWEREKKDSNILFVGNLNDFKNDYTVLQTFHNLNQKDGIVIISNK